MLTAQETPSPVPAKKPTHTPGPWEVVRHEYSPHRIYVESIGDWPRRGRSTIWFIQERKRGSHRGETARWLGFEPESEANASLIAAAPEMLDALEATLREFDCPARNTNRGYSYAQAVCFSSETRERVRAAIRKARGVQETEP